MDHLSPRERSRNMSRIRASDTIPEVSLRSALHRRGFRFRKNVATLPGKPDIVLPRHRTVVFVNGCYWHRHKNCKRATTPKTNRSYWRAKFAANVRNDAIHTRQLRQLGWKVLVVWECQLRHNIEEATEDLIRRLPAPA